MNIGVVSSILLDREEKYVAGDTFDSSVNSRLDCARFDRCSSHDQCLDHRVTRGKIAERSESIDLVSF